MKSIPLTHIWAIAITDIRRRIRKTRDNVFQVIAVAIFAIFMIPFVGGAVFGLFLFGSAIRTGSIETPVEFTRIGIVYTWIGIALFAGFRAYSIGLQPDRLEGMLTTVSHRTLLAGIVLAEVVLWGSIVGIVLLPITAAFALGAATPMAIPFLLLTGVLIFISALFVGFGAALVIRNMGVRSVLLTRLRTILLAILAVVYIGVFVTQAFETVLDPLYVLLAPTPVGWTADLALIATTDDASVWTATAALFACSIGILILGFSLTSLAKALWYADGVHVSHSGSETNTRFRWVEAMFPRSIAAVISTDWTRGRRAPITLSFVLYPLFILIWPLMTTFETGSVSSGLPLWVILCGAWMTGAIFTLNVLGHEGAVLPVTILSEKPARALVGGHIVAAGILGVPLTTVATLLLGYAAGYSPLAIGTLTAIALFLTLTTPMLASGIGAIFPRFDEVTISRSTTAVVPSLIAFGVYSLALTIIAMPGLLAHTMLGLWVGSLVGVRLFVIQLGGTILTILLGSALGLGSMWFAYRRIQRFELD